MKITTIEQFPRFISKIVYVHFTRKRLSINGSRCSALGRFYYDSQSITEIMESVLCQVPSLEIPPIALPVAWWIFAAYNHVWEGQQQ
jgi:hypothetical protein